MIAGLFGLTPIGHQTDWIKKHSRITLQWYLFLFSLIYIKKNAPYHDAMLQLIEKTITFANH